MELNARTIGVIVAALLLVVGIYLVTITEESGEAGSGASGGTSDASEETRPYLWWGILLIIVSLAGGAWAWMQEDPSGR